MTLQQMSQVKCWLQTHQRRCGIEYQLWDAMLTCWLLGWMGLPAGLLLEPMLAALACPLLFFAPSLYVHLRARLHRRGVLRCDWLPSAQLA